MGARDIWVSREAQFRADLLTQDSKVDDELSCLMRCGEAQPAFFKSDCGF